MQKTREIYKDGQLFSTEVYDDGLSAAHYLAHYRNAKENGGIMINGFPVQTDQQARANILGAKALGIDIKWKTPLGFVSLNPEEINTIAQAVGVHVQKCFAVEALLENEAFDTREELEKAFDTAYAAL